MAAPRSMLQPSPIMASGRPRDLAWRWLVLVVCGVQLATTCAAADAPPNECPADSQRNSYVSKDKHLRVVVLAAFVAMAMV